jgi:hypothetical protein
LLGQLDSGGGAVADGARRPKGVAGVGRHGMYPFILYKGLCLLGRLVIYCRWGCRQTIGAPLVASR